jgi:uncharacterized protein DUF4115
VARLRIRIELNRGGMGVPLHKLASVVDEAQKFFHMLAEDVHIDKGKGEWLGFEFDHESLNFTAEYVGPVTEEQVTAFYAAFDGTTSLRRSTIAQFAHIADAVGEDEIIGFGLYQSEDRAEPTEWRSLSRRDALRIADEIQLLLGATGGLETASHLPAVSNASAGARVFADRRDRSLDQSRWADAVREMETNLSKRITRVENRVEEHSGMIRDLRTESSATEDSFRNLLTAVESFCDQATRQIERIAPPGLPAAIVKNEPAKPPEVEKTTPRRRTMIGVAAVLAIAFVFFTLRAWMSSSGPPVEQKVAAASPPPVPAPVIPAPVIPAPDSASPTPRTQTRASLRVDLEAAEPTWVAVTETNGKTPFSGLMVPGESRSFELAKDATVRTGNAAGLIVRVDGKPLGSLGPHGKIREIQFKDGASRIVEPK